GTGARPRAPAALTLSAPRRSRGPVGCLSNHGGCGERSGGARREPRGQMTARSSLLRRPTLGARPARRTSSVVAALAALAPRLVRLARPDYPDGLLAVASQHGDHHAADLDVGGARDDRSELLVGG